MLIRDLEAVALCMPRANVRDCLNGVLFAKNGDIVCTDGQRCHVVQTGESREAAFILGYADVKRVIQAASAAQRRQGATFFADLAAGVVQVGAATSDILCKPINAEYVDYVDFFPKANEQPQAFDSVGLTLHGEYMHHVTKGLALHTGAKEAASVPLHFYRNRSRDFMILLQEDFRAVVVVQRIL